MSIDEAYMSFHGGFLWVVDRQQDTQFHAPQHLRHTIDAFENKGFSNITAAYCVPISPGRSRVLVKQPFRFKSPIPRFIFSAPQSPPHVPTFPNKSISLFTE